jgi:DNA-binding MarR family transcriptional regulator
MADETAGKDRETAGRDRETAGNDREAQVASCRAHLGTVFDAMRGVATPTLLALDLTLAQLRALVTLHVHGSQTIGGLGRALGVSEPTASLLVERLVRRGLVRRGEDAADRRRVLVSLTESAAHAFEAVRADGERAVDDWLARLGADDLAALTTGLRALALVSGVLHGLCATGGADAAAAAKGRDG